MSTVLLVKTNKPYSIEQGHQQDVCKHQFAAKTTYVTHKSVLKIALLTFR